MAVVDPIGIKVFLVKAELGLEVCLIPKYYSVSELSSAASNESLYEWVTPRNIGKCARRSLEEEDEMYKHS